jgi:hypothetical protein
MGICAFWALPFPLLARHFLEVLLRKTKPLKFVCKMALYMKTIPFTIASKKSNT